jgi:hypothetical protein
MSMEYAGAVEVVPPLRGGAQDWVRTTGWTPSRDGQTIRPRAGISLDECVCALRDLVSMDAGRRSYTGTVAAYDDISREMVMVTARDDRVTRRTLRKRSGRSGTNVIDLATHHRAISRAIS